MLTREASSVNPITASRSVSMSPHLWFPSCSKAERSHLNADRKHPSCGCLRRVAAGGTPVACSTRKLPFAPLNDLKPQRLHSRRPLLEIAAASGTRRRYKKRAADVTGTSAALNSSSASYVRRLRFRRSRPTRNALPSRVSVPGSGTATKDTWPDWLITIVPSKLPSRRVPPTCPDAEVEARMR